MKRIFLVIIVIVACLTVSSVLAQDEPNTIEYGQTIIGEITNQTFEVPYVFVGKQGDAIVIEMAPVDVLGEFTSPAIILLDANSNVIGAVESGYGTIVLAAKLPADSEYTILASRYEGRAGDSVGEFTLSLIEPPVLSVNEPLQETASSTSTNYYVVEMAGNFTISYEKLAGDFYPAVLIYQTEEGGELKEMASMQGEVFIKGMLSIEVMSTLNAETYFVAVQEALFDFNFDEVTADYTIELMQ